MSRAQAGQWTPTRDGFARYAAPLFRMELAEVTPEGWRVWFQIGDNDDAPDKSGEETGHAGCLAADAALREGDVGFPSSALTVEAKWLADEEGGVSLERTPDLWLMACVNREGGWTAWGVPELSLAPVEGTDSGEKGRDAVIEILALNGLTVLL